MNRPTSAPWIGLLGLAASGCAGPTNLDGLYSADSGSLCSSCGGTACQCCCQASRCSGTSQPLMTLTLFDSQTMSPGADFVYNDGCVSISCHLMLARDGDRLRTMGANHCALDSVNGGVHFDWTLDAAASTISVGDTSANIDLSGSATPTGGTSVCSSCPSISLSITSLLTRR